MTVKELRDMLAKEDDDRIVVMSRDAEGNSYSPLSEFGTCAYCAETTWSGYIDDETIGDGDDDTIGDGVPALVMYPVN